MANVKFKFLKSSNSQFIKDKIYIPEIVYAIRNDVGKIISVEEKSEFINNNFKILIDE